MANPAKLTVRDVLPNWARVWPVADVIDTTGMVPVLAADTAYQPDHLALVVTAKGAVSVRIASGDIPPSVRQALGTLSVPLAPLTASLAIDPAGADNGIAYTANAPGSQGNEISVTYVDPGAPDRDLQVQVRNKAIRVLLETNAAAAIVSTADDVVTAVNAHWLAGHLVTAAHEAGSTGLGVVAAAATAALAGGADMDATHATLTTALAGGNNDIIWTAVVGGEAGNDITIEYEDPGLADQALAVTVLGNAVTVSLATGAAPGMDITSTANDIIAEVASTPAAAALVSGANAAANDGSGVVAALAATNLTGGADLTAIYGPFEGARFAQDNGDLNVNFEIINGTADVICFRLPG